MQSKGRVSFLIRISVIIFETHCIISRYQHKIDIFSLSIRMAEVCGHNFCHECIAKVIADHDEWYCPECRSVQVKRADDLTRNRLVEKAVESLNASGTQIQNINRCSHHNLELSLCK